MKKLIIAVLALVASVANAQSKPELPRVLIDTTYVAPTGTVTAIAVGGNLQAALNAANCGDTISLAAGATFTGNFVLPSKPCTAWTIIRTSTPDAKLPAPGVRVTPANMPLMAKIVSPNVAPAVAAKFAASHYRLIGLEITSTGTFSYGLVDFGTDPVLGRIANTIAELPHDMIVDRCVIHGTATMNTKRGVTLNGASLAVIDSWISDIHNVGQDTQAIIGYNGTGPFKVVNNELQAAGENVMFGGARPSLKDNIPADIEIRGNHFVKPLNWKVGYPYFATHWSVKNLLEFKAGQRVLITGNIFENNWPDAQVGFALLITPRTNGNGTTSAPFDDLYVQDISITYNIFRHVANGINISGADNYDPFQTTRGRRILIQNNLFYDIGFAWSSGMLYQVLSNSDSLTIDHNTGIQSGTLISFDGKPSTNFIFTNNIAPNNAYGVHGSGAGNPINALSVFAPGAVFTNNVVEGYPYPLATAGYPPTTLFAPDWKTVQFVSPLDGDYSLAATSPYQNIGADIAGIKKATATAIK